MNKAKSMAALIVGASPAVTQALEQILRESDISTVTAQNDYEAAKKMLNQKFAVICVAGSLSQKGGVQGIANLRQKLPELQTPLVLVSDNPADKDLRSRAGSVLGVEHIFITPLKSNEITTWIQRHIFGQKQRKYDATIINAFLNGTIAAVEGNSRVTPAKLTPTVKERGHTLGEFTGVIQFQGKTSRGVVALSFERNCIKRLADTVFQGAITDFTDEILIDFAGELCNQTAGQTQAIFQSKGTRFEIGTPTLIQGMGNLITHKFDAPCLVLPFTWKGEKFFTEFVMETFEGPTSKANKPEEPTRVADSGDVSFL
jgi:CheY-specific phosphatase CheX/CheY-like chemotaxis protein